MYNFSTTLKQYSQQIEFSINRMRRGNYTLRWISRSFEHFDGDYVTRL